ncbi:MAG: Gfo/Idh/MocA family oxidoreductase [Abditibacteriota bacterium]|nr:Gfo/Idh/MocA family oxidoreductase [Abditibacteriota bacterium]
MNPIRLAIIGNGLISHAHAAGFGAIEGVKLVACCDIIEDKAKAFAEKYGIPSYYTDHRELLDREKPDAVSVAVPDAAHAVISMDALARGIHTLCEKPLSYDLKSAGEMKDAALKALSKGVVNGVNFAKRSYGCSQKAAQLVRSGELGRILRFEAHYRQSWRIADYWGKSSQVPAFQWRMSKRHGSLGCIGDIGVHVFDLVSYVCGDFEGMYCTLDNYGLEPGGEGEYVFDANEAMHAIVRLKSGITGSVNASRTDTGFGDEVALLVFGDKGALDLNQTRKKEDMLLVCKGSDIHTAVWKPAVCPPDSDNFSRFIESVRTGKQGSPSFEEAWRVQKYLDAGFRSAETGSYVTTD